MARSTEYPDLTFVEPRAWRNANRASVQLIVIHDTEGSSHGQSAEDGAAYDARRTDGTSTHYFHDNNSTVQCVRTEDVAFTARAQGNARGIQHELCDKASQSGAQWTDEYSLAMLQVAAKQCARDVIKWGIPVRKLTPAQVAAGVKGFCGHADITRAFPQDRGTHTDPGPNFPWARFLDMVRDIVSPPKPQPVEDNTMTAAEATQGVLGYKGGGLPGDIPGGNFLNYFTKAYNDDHAADEADEARDTALANQVVAGNAMLAALVAEPSDDHPLVKAYRYALANPEA